MKITKLLHSCLLVEMPAPVNRTALFDPGIWSEEALDVDSLEFLDNIIITHGHSDHMSIPLIKKLVAKFPEVRITAPFEVTFQLKNEEIDAISEESPGITFFTSPHEAIFPGAALPEQIGVHYLDMLSVPGDSHSFAETRPILALPVAAPWGSTVNAANLALELKPKYIIPVHDWHWNEQARMQMYDKLENICSENDIVFCRMETGKPVVINL